MGSRVGRRSELNLALQAAALRRQVEGSCVQLTPGHLVWIGLVQPTPDTGKYELRIELRQGHFPSVRVLSPALKPNDSGLLPHVYTSGALCLSGHGQWEPTMLLTETFLPWACEWLTFYELWSATGLWYGDGPQHLDTAWQASILHAYR
jgi:hypothetical protein